jgi:hypothetical protein
MTVINEAVPLEPVGCRPRRAFVAMALLLPSPLPLAATPVYTPYSVQQLVKYTVGNATYSGIASPELHIGICHGLASSCIDNVDVEVSDRTLLTGEEVLPDQFTNNP